MKQSTKNEVQGALHEVKGKVKEKVGQATSHPELEAEGQAESDTCVSRRESMGTPREERR